MEMLIDPLGEGGGNTLDSFQILRLGAGNFLGGAEMIEKRALSFRANPRNAIKWIGPKGFLSLGAVGTNRKPMCFVAQSLQHEKPRITRR